MPHPAPWHRAEFGTTDVWLIRFEGRYGVHSLPTDFDAALAAVGLRSPSGGEGAGGDSARLASFLVRRGILRRLNEHFHRSHEGAPGLGLAISFPMEAPEGAARPAAGTSRVAAPGLYNVMSIVAGPDEVVFGRAIEDGPSNESVENCSPVPGGDHLGIFVDQVIERFNHAYQNAILPASPVTEADVGALRALVYGLPSPGGRHDEIGRVAEGFAQTIADLCAHEIGHSLGLEHTTPTEDGSLMNAGATVSAFLRSRFRDADVATLARVLPGARRR
jgi:hypothetical protein